MRGFKVALAQWCLLSLTACVSQLALAQAAHTSSVKSRAVRAMLKAGAKVNVSSYTLYLKRTNPANAQDTFTCTGFDPVIVNQDN